MAYVYRFFAPCPRGLEGVLTDELRELGAQDASAMVAGVAFQGLLETGYRCCLWSRIATRILLELDRFRAATPEQLYAGARDFPFEEHFNVTTTFAVEFTSTLSEIRHTNYGALKTKDAIVDRFRDIFGTRPTVDRDAPEIRFHVHVHEEVASLYLDLSGERLHRRGWRAVAQEAPLKENLAAGILRLAGWPEASASGRPLVDPMCGSGTFLAEAGLMALDVAPGLLRGLHGMGHWHYHLGEVWARLEKEARERDRRGRGELLSIAGFDNDERAVEAATRNFSQAGLAGVLLERRELAMAEPVGEGPGIVLCNPPYGIRLDVGTSLSMLYQRLGMTLKSRFQGWSAFVFTANLDAAKHLGLRVARRHQLFNGALDSRLLAIPILPPKLSPVEFSQQGELEQAETGSVAESERATDFSNRIKKNIARLKKWREREGISCYRLYDGDLPEYALTIDVFGRWVHVQESERPATIDPLKAEQRLHDAVAALPTLLGVASDDIFVKQRFRQRGASQYGKFGNTGVLREVDEYGLRFLVNMTDYFDAGLFLDHRPMRQLIRSMAHGKRFLNLFAYTGSATVYAAAGGATSTTTVDLSQTYLAWAGKNMQLNGFCAAHHRFVHADVLQWLAQEPGEFDLIFIDPPTFSNSKSMRETFDVQRDHVALLKLAASRMAQGGTILFSNNFRRFSIDVDALQPLQVEEISKRTIPPDFAKDAKAHVAFAVSLPAR